MPGLQYAYSRDRPGAALDLLLQDLPVLNLAEKSFPKALHYCLTALSFLLTIDPKRRGITSHRGERKLTNWLTTLSWRIAAIAAATAGPALALAASHSVDRSEYHAPYAAVAPVVDGIADDAIWAQAEWRDISHRWARARVHG